MCIETHHHASINQYSETHDDASVRLHASDKEKFFMRCKK